MPQNLTNWEVNICSGIQAITWDNIDPDVSRQMASWGHINGLVQERRNSIATLELSLSCTNPSTWVKALMNPLPDCSDLNWLEEQPWGIETPIHQCLTNELLLGETISAKSLKVSLQQRFDELSK